MGTYKTVWLLVFLLQVFENGDCRGTITPNPRFSAGQAATQLRKAMSGWGTDEQTLINVLTKHTLQQRKQIAAEYERRFDDDLIEDFEDETEAHFETALVGLLMHPLELGAYFVNEALKGFGTDERGLIAILVSLDNGQMPLFKNIYYEEHDENLEETIRYELSEVAFEDFMLTLTAYDRQFYGTIDEKLALEDATYLAGASDNPVTSEGVNIIFASRSYAHLNKTFWLYKEKTNGLTIDYIIKSTFSGYHMEALLAVVKRAMDPVGYYTYWLHYSMNMYGTDENLLSWILITRSEIDLADIANRYNSQYRPTLEEKIEDETSSDYERLLLKILRPY